MTFSTSLNINKTFNHFPVLSSAPYIHQSHNTFAQASPPNTIPIEPVSISRENSNLSSRINSLKKGEYPIDRPFRVLQLGDSHTAGDSFSERLRSQLQNIYGNGGIGWIIPGRVPGQSSTRYDIKSSGNWKFTYGYGSDIPREVPLGGYVNTGAKGSRLTIVPLVRSGGNWQFSALVRSAVKGESANIVLGSKGNQNKSFTIGDQWSAVDLGRNASLQDQYSLDVTSGRVDVAGFWLENDQPGIVVDHIGRNGATIYAFRKWSDSAIAKQLAAHPVDVILLEYGTNESVDNTLSSGYARSLSDTLSRLRTISPLSALVVITAPSFSQGGGNDCSTFKPRSLSSVVAGQLAAGQRLGVPVWNWMEAMGGACGVSSWHQQGLMASDWIHMTPNGYRRSADIFLRWLQNSP